jgi:uncharacterized membrane protein YqiK
MHHAKYIIVWSLLAVWVLSIFVILRSMWFSHWVYRKAREKQEREQFERKRKEQHERAS